MKTCKEYAVWNSYNDRDTKVAVQRFVMSTDAKTARLVAEVSYGGTCFKVTTRATWEKHNG